MKPSTTIIAALLVALAVQAANACTTEDIEIRQADWRTAPNGTGGTWLRSTGEVVNKCAEPVAAEIVLVFRDAEGRVVDQTRHWCYTSQQMPYYTTFPPGESCAFNLTIPGTRALEVRTMTAKVIDVRTQKQKDEWLRR
jgi:hypothetical protein